MPVVVVDQPKLFIVVFAAPLDGLGDVPFGGGFSVRHVGVDRPQVTGFPEDSRDVPGQIPPAAVTRCRLCGWPADAQPQAASGPRTGTIGRLR